MTSDATRALTVLASQNGLDDFRYFVGRKQLLLALQGCIAGNGSAWLHGPRRIGKTTLAQRVAQEAERAGGIVIFVDAGDLKGCEFETLLERVVLRAPTDMRATTGSARARFEYLETRSKELAQPVLIVFDEFDHIAVNLGLDEQAFLRRLNGENKRFRYLFVSRLDPALLVEEVSEERSRLLGICKNSRVKPFERKEIHELLRAVGRDLDCAAFDAHFERLWAAVGGHTMAVVTLVHTLAVQHVCGENEDEQLQEALRDRRQELDMLMAGFWRDLRPISRACLLRGTDELISEAEEDSLRFDGVFNTTDRVLRPSKLLDKGRLLGVAPSTGGGEMGSVNRFFKVERLHGLMTSINARAKLAGLEQAFSTTDESLKYFCLRRDIQDDGGVRDAAFHLYKVLVEGGRKPSGDKPWRLPGALASVFKKSPGIQLLLLVRNFFSHDPDHRDVEDVPSKRYTEIGAFYEDCCKVTAPARRDEWTLVRDRLVDEIITSLETLEQAMNEPAFASRNAVPGQPA